MTLFREVLSNIITLRLTCELIIQLKVVTQYLGVADNQPPFSIGVEEVTT